MKTMQLRRNKKKSEGHHVRTAYMEAVRLLSRREYSVNGLREKLTKKGYTPEQVAQAVSLCLEEGWVSDQRFAESLVRYRKSMGKGPRHIEHELRRNGIDDAIVQAVLDPDDKDWETSCLYIYRRKFGEAPPADPKMRAKVYRALSARGFTVEQIRLTLRKVENEHHE